MKNLAASSRTRSTAVLCGGALMAGAWLGPAVSAAVAAPAVAAPPAISATVALTASATALAPQDGPGGGPGGGSGGGSGVIPTPGGHHASESSSGSGGSMGTVSSGGSKMSLRGDQQSESMFQKVGHWLGFGGDDASSAAPAGGPSPAHKPKSAGAKQGGDPQLASAGAKHGKPGAQSGGDGKAAQLASKASGGVGDMLGGLFSGIGHLVKGALGL